MPGFEPYDVQIGDLTFGITHDWVCTQIDITGSTFRVQDADRPRRDGRHMGRDYETPGTWTLTVMPTRADSGSEVQAILPALLGGWRFADRTVPGAYTSLRYRLPDGGARQVFGRPRVLTPNVNKMRYGRTEVDLEFDLVDSTAYLDVSQSVSMELLPGSPAGLIFPAVAPFVFDSGNSSRQGMIHNTGSVPSPLRVEFRGPVVDPVVRSVTYGWQIGLNMSIAYDRTVTVDTRDMTVLRDDGASFAHTVTRHSDLGVMVNPGYDEIVYEGSDNTGTSRATVEWLTGLGPF